MKKMKNKVIVLIALIALLCTSGFYVANRVNASNTVNTTDEASNINNDDTLGEEDSLGEEDAVNVEASTVQAYVTLPYGNHLVNKDETVYVNLNYDGTVSKMNVVNFFKAEEAGIYLDYGNYVNIVNLTNDSMPQVEADSILWDLTNAEEDFYYQGQLNNGELPWTFTIEYKLNGEVVEASDLPGAVGEIIISINVEENKAADEYFRQNYMMQITVPLNMQNSTLISAPGAVQMIAGHTKTLAFTVLPQTSNRFEIKAQVQDFTMDAMDIAMMKADLSSYMDVDEMTKGFGAMSDGMEDLANGTGKLKDGITELSGGIDTLGSGLNKLSLGTPQLSEGMNQFGYGLNTFAGSLKGLSSGSNQMNEGMKGLAQNGKQLLSGYQEIEAGVSSLLTTKQELTAMAGEMVKSTDPQTVLLAQAILGQLEGMSSLQTGLETLNTNLDQYTQGVEQAAGQYDTLNKGINALPEGFDKLTGGYQDIKAGNKAIYSAIDQFNKGLSDINLATAKIPEQVQQLADGQIDMKGGLDQAVEEIKALAGTTSDQDAIKAVSFTAPGKIIPNSVQFVLRTPAIEKISESNESVETEVEKVSFWDKLFNLFQ